MTSGLQAGLVVSACDGTVATERDAERKRNHLQTAAICAEAGLAFIPFVFEAEGGLGREGRSVLSGLARDAARLTGDSPSFRGELASQALAVALQRANALAIARRAPGSAPPLAAPLAAARDQLRIAAALRLPVAAPVRTAQRAEMPRPNTAQQVAVQTQPQPSAAAATTITDLPQAAAGTAAPETYALAAAAALAPASDAPVCVQSLPIGSNVFDSHDAPSRACRLRDQSRSVSAQPSCPTLCATPSCCDPSSPTARLLPRTPPNHNR